MKDSRKIPASSLAKRNFQRFIGNRLAIVGAVLTILIILLSFAAPLLTPYDPTLIDPSIRELPPSSEHILGTDRVGRDIFARVLYGGRISILIGVTSALGAAALGVIIGCVSGYYGGAVDRILVFLSEIFMIFPSTLLILLCVGIMGQSIANIVLIFVLTGWPNIARVVRSKIMSLREEPFVESCVANGVSGMSIMFRHLLPNTMGPIIVNITLAVASYILAEAGLSFLNMGVPSNIPTWGNIINAAKRLDIIQNMPALWLAPGLAISLFVLGINFLGDGLRDALDTSQ